MTLTELIEQYRFEFADETLDYYCPDATVIRLFNQAETEACRRRPLLFDSTTIEVCRVAVTSASATYTKHTAIVAVLAAYLQDAAGDTINLDVVSRDEITRVDPDWRDTEGDPFYLIVDGKNLQITPPPTGDHTMFLEVQRLPLQKMASASDTPEIAEEHHPELVSWVIHKVYLRPDQDLFNKALSAEYDQKFTEYFGPRVSAEQGIMWRQDMPIRNNVTL